MPIVKRHHAWEDRPDPNDPDEHPSVLYPDFGPRYREAFSTCPKTQAWRKAEARSRRRKDTNRPAD